MTLREASPAVSENEFDISGALVASNSASSDSESEDAARVFDKPRSFTDIKETDFNLKTGDSSGDEAFIAAQQAAANRKSSNLKGKTVKKGGGFQAMGLNALLLKAITRKGFTIPTPIQRKAIPLILDGQDVVGMARTGSGKTAAFVVPMIEKLKSHSAKVGARAAILSPSRELALQTLKVVKELGRGTDLRTTLLVGGDNLEDQFGSLTTNPDIIIATPGRFLHLKIEMGLDLSSIKYVVFDEADRLFEMGFAAQLGEILHALPSSRQTLLFSATLPKSLVEFARAGLQEPKLIRLDADGKISPDLANVFFTLKSSEKEGALLYVLEELIKVPTGETQTAYHANDEKVERGKKRKREPSNINSTESPTPHSTIIFAATKHHVEYLSALLKSCGFATSYVYGSLDQTARKIQVHNFRSGLTNILIVTDVAARGIDIPILANVINYNFPPQPKVFVHRVGRTARAGRKGWSYSLICETDVPYLFDLQLFLGRKLVAGRCKNTTHSFTDDIVVGGLVRHHLEKSCETATRIIKQDDDVALLRSVAAKGEKLYLRTRNSASSQSAKRSKDFIASQTYSEPNMMFADDISALEIERDRMLARVSGFRPTETIFEIGKRGSGVEAVDVMRKLRERKLPTRDRNDGTFDAHQAQDREIAGRGDHSTPSLASVLGEDAPSESESEADQEVSVIHSSSKPTTKDTWEDMDHYMTYTPKSLNLVEDAAYGVHSGSYNKSGNSAFLDAARRVTMDLSQDESKGFGEASKARGLRWDKKSKKYVQRQNDEDGSRGSKLIIGESGHKIAATYRSGRFDAWKKANKLGKMPRVGEVEKAGRDHLNGAGRHFRHKKESAPKAPDKFRDDYYKRKKRLEETREKEATNGQARKARTELRGTDDVRKRRNLKERRREKNARPSKHRKT